MRDSSFAIVAPVHIQPSKEWVESVNRARGAGAVYIVDDSNGRVSLPKAWEVFPYDRQRALLGDARFERFAQFHKSPPCKNFGIWQAWRDLFDVIVVIDSDCILPENFIEEHLGALSETVGGWENPLEGTGWHSRGFPYHKRARPVDVNMGLWTNELDVNGQDRVDLGVPPKEPLVRTRKVAHGVVPLSGMNVAFRREVTPAMMFMPHFDHEEWNFRRHDDIWGGYVLQKIMHKLDRKLSYGAPWVYHDTIVIPQKDADDERAMIAHEERFYSFIDEIMSDARGNDYGTVFADFTEKAGKKAAGERAVFAPLVRACELWVEKFS